MIADHLRLGGQEQRWRELRLRSSRWEERASERTTRVRTDIGAPALAVQRASIIVEQI